MNKIFLLGLLIISSCTGREIINKELVGIWVLKGIKSELIDSKEELYEFRTSNKDYVNNLKLKIDNNSKYIFSMNIDYIDIDEKTDKVRELNLLLEEHGKIINENDYKIQWKPLYIMDDKNVIPSNFIAGSRQKNDYILSYEFGPLPLRRTTVSSFKIIDNQLNLINDIRLSYYENVTGRAKDNKQIKTQLVFERE